MSKESCHIFITDLVPDFTQPSETEAQKERFQGTFETHAAHPIYRDNIGPITLSLKSDIVLGGWRTEDHGPYDPGSWDLSASAHRNP